MEPEVKNQFGRLHEVTRNIFAERIEGYFKTQSVNRHHKELPTIRKYEITQDAADRHSTAQNIIMYFPDAYERLPMIAVTTVSGRQKPMNLGFPTQYQHNHYRVVASANPAPYTLVENDNLTLRIGGKDYEIVFMLNAFKDWNNISLDELNEYLLQVLSFVKVQDVEGRMGLFDFYSRDLYITGGTAADKFGFTVGQGPDLKKFYEVLSLAEDLEVLIDVLASDRNQRIEVMDIISTLFGLYIYDENIGQWLFPLIANHHTGGQIIFNGEYNRRGESEINQEGAPISKVYADSISVGATVILYLTRVKHNEFVKKIMGGDDAN